MYWIICSLVLSLLLERYVNWFQLSETFTKINGFFYNTKRTSVFWYKQPSREGMCQISSQAPSIIGGQRCQSDFPPPCLCLGLSEHLSVTNEHDLWTISPPKVFYDSYLRMLFPLRCRIKYLASTNTSIQPLLYQWPPYPWAHASDQTYIHKWFLDQQHQHQRDTCSKSRLLGSTVSPLRQKSKNSERNQNRN